MHLSLPSTVLHWLNVTTLKWEHVATANTKENHEKDVKHLISQYIE